MEHLVFVQIVVTNVKLVDGFTFVKIERTYVEV